MDKKSVIDVPVTLRSDSKLRPAAPQVDPPTASTSELETLSADSAVLADACNIQGDCRDQFLSRFLMLIHENDFEFGYSNAADRYVRESLVLYGTFAREWISELFVQNYCNPFVLGAILRVIAHFEYAQMYPQGMTMAAAGVAHDDISVKECGVRCFENWGHIDGRMLLMRFEFSEAWLNEYRIQVINDLERAVTNATTCPQD
ncbi:MAG: hypothetical protein IH984_10490 [Planctomycetes bacterium]|nr:hypothetical protein [Planctomycetota bacterium]